MSRLFPNSCSLSASHTLCTNWKSWLNLSSRNLRWRSRFIRSRANIADQRKVLQTTATSVATITVCILSQQTGWERCELPERFALRRTAPSSGHAHWSCRVFLQRRTHKNINPDVQTFLLFVSRHVLVLVWWVQPQLCKNTDHLGLTQQLDGAHHTLPLLSPQVETLSHTVSLRPHTAWHAPHTKTYMKESWLELNWNVNEPPAAF